MNSIEFKKISLKYSIKKMRKKIFKNYKFDKGFYPEYILKLSKINIKNKKMAKIFYRQFTKKNTWF